MSRSYGASLPSSLTVNLSSASVCSTRPPVSVSGTGRLCLKRRSRIFSGACSSMAVARRKRLAYCRVSAPGFPPRGQPTSLQRTFPSVRACFASPSPLRLDRAGSRNIDRVSIHIACTACVRSRLTLNRLALFRNPWSFGDGVSRPIYRYLYLHLLFRRLQPVSRQTFADGGMLPYRLTYPVRPTSSAPDLCPIIIHAGPLD